MAVPKVGEHSIIPCSQDCGVYVRPKRMLQEVAEELVRRLHGQDAVVKVNTGRGICTTCRNRVDPPPSRTRQADERKAAQRKAQSEKIAEERLALARLAAEQVARGRAQRASNRPRRVSLGQSMVRI